MSNLDVFADPQFRLVVVDLDVTVAPPQEVGRTVHGVRRLIPIRGGSASGDEWSTKVLAGGADFQPIVNNRMAELGARYVLETDGGDLIYVQNRAVRSDPPELIARLVRGDPVDLARIYFKCSPSFRTASRGLRCIAERMFYGSGTRHPGKVVMRFHELL